MFGTFLNCQISFFLFVSLLSTVLLFVFYSLFPTVVFVVSLYHVSSPSLPYRSPVVQRWFCNNGYRLFFYEKNGLIPRPPPPLKLSIRTKLIGSLRLYLLIPWKNWDTRTEKCTRRLFYWFQQRFYNHCRSPRHTVSRARFRYLSHDHEFTCPISLPVY